MNGLHKTLIAILFSSTALFAGTASAVSPDGEWTLHRHNAAGTFFAVMRPHANHFCFLTKVGVRETDTGGELAQCRVRRSGTVWLLEARLGTSSDADVFCTANCYNN